jgi:hypothetical protein
LKIGQIITIPELEEFKAEKGRMVHQWPTQKSSEYVSGARMILFLRDATKIPTDSDQDAFLNTRNESWSKCARRSACACRVSIPYRRDQGSQLPSRPLLLESDKRVARLCLRSLN